MIKYCKGEGQHKRRNYNFQVWKVWYLLLLENKTVSHLQLMQAAKNFQNKKLPRGKDQIKGLAIRPFAKTSETLKVEVTLS